MRASAKWFGFLTFQGFGSRGFKGFRGFRGFQGFQKLFVQLSPKDFCRGGRLRTPWRSGSNKNTKNHQRKNRKGSIRK